MEPAGKLPALQPVIRAEGLGKRYRLGEQPMLFGSLRDFVAERLRSGGPEDDQESGPRGDVWALRDLDLEVGEGEVLGVIGRNGSGKTTLLKVLSRITEPTAGRVELRGRVGSLLEVGTGFHPDLTGRENVYLNGAILGMGRREIEAKLDRIVEFSGVARFLDTPVRRYSSGMYLRLAFSVAAHLEPDLLLVDEVLAVGDSEFRARCLGKMDEVARTGRTVLFVSHNLAAVSRLCHRVILLDAGRKLADGTPGEALRAYSELLGRGGGEARSAGEALALRGLAVEPAEDGALEAGRPFRARFELSVHRELAAVSLRLSLRDAEDRLALHVRLDGEATAPLLAPGDRALSAELPALWLAPGPYSLTAKAIGERLDRPRERCVSDPLMIEVVNPELGDLAAPGLLRPACRWRIDPLP
jgi:lipopolysaccharide transport system ATP-binding protein